MTVVAYHVDLTPDDNDTVLVTCPDLPGVVTFGDDDDDALTRAVGAIEEMLAAMIADRDEIPAPTYRGGHPVPLTTRTSLKATLYRAMRAKGWRKADLVRALHLHPPQVDRIFDLNHETRLDQLDAAFAALGMRIVAEVRMLNAA